MSMVRNEEDVLHPLLLNEVMDASPLLLKTTSNPPPPYFEDETMPPPSFEDNVMPPPPSFEDETMPPPSFEDDVMPPPPSFKDDVTNLPPPVFFAEGLKIKTEEYLKVTKVFSCRLWRKSDVPA
jgi:hypothetical protein